MHSQISAARRRGRTYHVGASMNAIESTNTVVGLASPAKSPRNAAVSHVPLASRSSVPTASRPRLSCGVLLWAVGWRCDSPRWHATYWLSPMEP